MPSPFLLVGTQNRMGSMTSMTVSSAAAFTALHCDEIYFMHEGAMGSMTMFAGGVAKQGAELEAWLKMAGEVASESGRDPQIARCMINGVW